MRAVVLMAALAVLAGACGMGRGRSGLEGSLRSRLRGALARGGLAPKGSPRAAVVGGEVPRRARDPCAPPLTAPFPLPQSKPCGRRVFTQRHGAAAARGAGAREPRGRARAGSWLRGGWGGVWGGAARPPVHRGRLDPRWVGGAGAGISQLATPNLRLFFLVNAPMLSLSMEWKRACAWSCCFRNSCRGGNLAWICPGCVEAAC